MELVNQESNISILSTDPDKIEKYKDLLQRVIPIIKNSTNEIEKRAGYDFNILLKAAINENNNSVFMFLNDAIEHLLRYFAKDLNNFLSGKEEWGNYCHPTYELIHDLAMKIMQSLLYKDHLSSFRKFCLDI